MHTGSLTLLPPHIHFSFRFSSLKVTSTLSYSLLRQCLKNDEPCGATPTPTMWLNKDPLLFLPGILNISPPSLGSLQRIPSTQERFLSRWRDFPLLVKWQLQEQNLFENMKLLRIPLILTVSTKSGRNMQHSSFAAVILY